MISKKRGCLGIFILFMILFIILVVIASNEKAELVDKISVLAKEPENLDSLQKYCLQYKKTFSKVLENCNEALALLAAAEEKAKEQARIEQAQKDSLAEEAMAQAKREQVQKDSLAMEQAKKDSLLRKINYEYERLFRDYDGRNFNSNSCDEEKIVYIVTNLRKD